MQKYIYLVVVLIITVPLCNNAMENKSVIIDISNNSSETIQQNNNRISSDPFIRHFKYTIARGLQSDTKNKVCNLLRNFSQKYPTEYSGLKQSLGYQSDETSITRGRKQSKFVESNKNQEQLVVILHVIADAFKKSAQEAEENNKTQQEQIDLLKDQNNIMVGQAQKDRRITLCFGVLSLMLGVATTVLGVYYSTC